MPQIVALKYTTCELTEIDKSDTPQMRALFQPPFNKIENGSFFKKN